MRKKPEIKFEKEGVYELGSDSIFKTSQQVEDYCFHFLDVARKQKKKFYACSFFNQALSFTRYGYYITKECLLELLHYADLTFDQFVKYKRELGLRIPESDWFFRFSRKWLNNMNKIA